MNSQLLWFHELAAAGKGPDWVFSARFAPNSHALLSASVRMLAPQGFTYYRATQADCAIHSRVCDYDLYVDNQQYDAIIALLEGRQQRNIYVYHTLHACQGEFQLVRGYGGYPGEHGGEETRCIRALATTPGLAMRSWNIFYGGVTYPYEQWAEGKTASELLQYLDRQVSG